MPNPAPTATRALLLTALLTATSPTQAQTPNTPAQPGAWQLLHLSYRAQNTRPADPADALWAPRIAQATNHPIGISNKGLPIYLATFADDDRTIVLSIAQQLEPTCDNGPNDANTTRDYAICPAKLAIIQSGRLIKSKTVGKLCAEAINPDREKPNDPTYKDPAKWGTRGRYNPFNHTIQLITMQNGPPERTCSTTIRSD